MSARPFVPKVVTANDLLIGDVIYLTANGDWSRHHHEAVLLEDADLAAQQLKGAAAQSDKLVGAYLADAIAGAHGPEPVHFREVFRANGPSEYVFPQDEGWLTSKSAAQGKIS